MQSNLLNYYEAIERASAHMLQAARSGDWDEVAKHEGACVLLISQLKHAAREEKLAPDAARQKARLMQRILVAGSHPRPRITMHLAPLIMNRIATDATQSHGCAGRLLPASV
jgi:flagellar protein FliT